MKKTLLSLAVGLSLMSVSAMASNPVSTDTLIKVTKLSLEDYATNNPTMAPSISGYKVTTTAPNVTVVIDMDADGMDMTATYLCVPAGTGTEFACHFQN